MPNTLAEQVTENIDATQTHYNQVLGSWEDRPFFSFSSISGDADAAIDAIKSVGRLIDGWAERGTDALDAGGLPAGRSGRPLKSWGAWVAEGEAIANGLRDIDEQAANLTLDNIEVTIAETKATAKRVSRNVASGATAAVAGGLDVAGPLVRVALFGILAAVGIKAFVGRG